MDDPLPPDPYEALGIAKDAPLAAVRSAHRKLVLTCHPDKVTDESAKRTAADKFHLVQQAYEILSDETRRQRYDERARLAELRADVSSQRNGRIIPEMVPRTKTTTFERRGDRTYEERVPRWSYEDEENYFQPRTPRFQEIRPKRFDERSFVQSPRRTPGRTAEDKRSRAKDLARELEEERDRKKKEAARADDKAYRAERSKKRDRERKRDSEDKSRSTKYAYVEEDTDSDSDVTETIYPRREEPLRRRYEDDVRRPELPRRNTTAREEYDSYGDSDRKHMHAQDYIAQSAAQARPVESEFRRPPPSTRAYSHVDARPPLAPKGPPPPIDTRRSSGREKARREPSPPSKSSKKDRRPTEIVDPPATNRRPSLPIHTSDPRGLKGSLVSSRKEAHRSQTLDTVPEKKPQPLKRAETMPIDKTRRSENQPSKSSRLKEQHDSGYSSRSSRGTPDISPIESPQLKSTKYRYSHEDSTDSEDEITIVAEPDGGYQRVQENSPKPRRPPMTPQSASKMQTPPMRSGSFAMSPDQPPTPRTAPPFIRSESGRPPPPRSRPSARGSLPYEIPHSEDPSYRIVNQSPKIGREHVSYSPRRGSDDVERDAYPAPHRPGLSRGDSRAVRT